MIWHHSTLAAGLEPTKNEKLTPTNITSRRKIFMNKQQKKSMEIKNFQKNIQRQKERYREIVHNNESTNSVLQKKKGRRGLEGCTPKYANHSTKKC